jgi:Rrf2 family transcriptional regulator, iron-sulfur cluster assembly transcription factor
MRLEISRRADLAVRALVALSSESSRMKAGDLARVLDTTPGFVPQIVGPLVKRGWVRSEPGPRGGYSASGDLDEVTVLDVIEAVDGPTDLGHCVVADRPCGGAPHCALHVAWGRARDELLDQLRQVSLEQLAAGSAP